MQTAITLKRAAEPVDGDVPLRLSVVIPAFNEEGVIANTVRALVAKLEGARLDYELLIINDGSADRTEPIVAELEALFPKLRHLNNPSPHGYGYAVRLGLAHYEGDAVAVVMADGSDSPDDLVRYFQKLREGYDCAFGHRFAASSRMTGYPFTKAIANRLGNWLIACLIDRRYSDFTNGFKCFRRSVIERMQPLVSGKFNLTIEMSIKAVLSGARYAVIPNDWTGRTSGESKFRIVRMARSYLMTIAYCLTRHWLVRADPEEHRRVDVPDRQYGGIGSGT
jgi:dolichol-phosphate mannosyltransferase